MALRVLLTNLTLASRTGTEAYVRDLALALQRRGHAPLVYSPRLGEIAEEIRAATVPVIDDLDKAPFRPDVIHGQHHPEVMAALFRHPGVPAVFVCHDWEAWCDEPPRFPRLLRYVAVDDTCRDRLMLEAGIEERRVEVLLNFVDLDRFRGRSALPPKPSRALVFSNLASEANALPAIREACRRHAIALDAVGAAAGRAVSKPEAILGDYDLVFARGRSALEAMAVGAAVIVCGAERLGSLVKSERFDEMRRLNFGRRLLQRRLDADAVAEEIAGYDAADAAAVSRRVCATASLDAAVDRWIAIYEEVIDEGRSLDAGDGDREWRAASRYVRDWERQWIALDRWLCDREASQRELDVRLADHERLGRELASARAELARHYASTAVRLRNRLVGVPLLGALFRTLARRVTER